MWYTNVKCEFNSNCAGSVRNKYEVDGKVMRLCYGHTRTLLSKGHKVRKLLNRAARLRTIRAIAESLRAS